MIQAAAKEYFFLQHCNAGLDAKLFNIAYAPKKSGVLNWSYL